jgi:multiple sugar transport system ATP-binding protein
MAHVRIENIVKKFAGGVTAVDNVSLDIPDGKFVILVGPSGCGKTTLLRLLAGLEEASSGRIFIGDKNVTDVHPRERNIAMVFQSYALYPHMSVRRNMGFALELKKVPRAEIDKRIAAAADILGINALLDRQPKQLSGGQRQRVALGRAIVREPAVFLFDEPLSNLDAKLRTAMRSELIKLHKRLGTTIVYVTHDQVEAMTIDRRGDEGWRRSAGRRTTRDLSQSENLFVANSSTSTMNFLRDLRLSGTKGEANAGAISLPLEGMVLQEAKRAAADELVVGIRPEHLTLVPKGVSAAGRILVEGVVEVVEPLGAETILELNCVGRSLVARLMGDDVPQAGEKVRLCAEPRQFFVFDARSGERLGFPG